MPKKKKHKKVFKHFLFQTRKGFYLLVTACVILMLTAINMYGSANFESRVLGEKNEDQEADKRQDEERKEEKKQEAEKRREEEKQKIEQKYEINSEKIKLEYQYEDATTKIKRKVEMKDGEQQIEEEVEDELGQDLEESFEEENEVEIASDSSEISIRKNKIKARTGFPLTIDGATNQLIVTRPDGTTKIVSVLPDEAVANFMRHKKINLINFEEPDSTPSADTDEPGTSTSEGTLTEDETEINLVEYDDTVAYEIKGKKKLKFLGFFDVTTPTTGYVSAETGEVIGQDEPLITRLLDLLSP